jgi:hypothetical protein
LRLGGYVQLAIVIDCNIFQQRQQYGDDSSNDVGRSAESHPDSYAPDPNTSAASDTYATCSASNRHHTDYDGLHGRGQQHQRGRYVYRHSEWEHCGGECFKNADTFVAL